jgi:hypothetical protein
MSFPGTTSAVSEAATDGALPWIGRRVRRTLCYVAEIRRGRIGRKVRRPVYEDEMPGAAS